MKKKAFILATAMTIPMIPATAHACCVETIAAIGVLATTLTTALFDGGSGGKPIVRVVREMQATDSMNTSKIRETVETSAEQMRNGEIAYGQQEQQLEMSRRALDEFPDVSADICGQFAIAETAQDARQALKDIRVQGSNAGMRNANKYDSPSHAISDLKKTIEDKGIAYASAGTITHPGCTPIYDPNVTLFSNKIPVPVGWNCTDAKDAPNTIPEKNVEAAQAVINGLVDFEPVAQSRVGDRKTPAGQVYEVKRSIHRAQMDLYRDFAQDALSMYLPTHDLTFKARNQFISRGVNVPSKGKISEMDYLSKQVQSRWGSEKYMAEMYGMPEKNLLIAILETQDLQNAIMFNLVELENKSSILDMIHLSQEYNDSVIPVLQEARVKAVAP